MTNESLTASHRLPSRPSFVSVAAATVAGVTAIAYAASVDGGLAASPHHLFVRIWLGGLVNVAGVAAFSPKPIWRAILATVAGVGMLAAGSAGVATIGGPLAVAGVLQTLGALISLEDAAKQRSRIWLEAAAIAIGTIAAFAIGVVGTSLNGCWCRFRRAAATRGLAGGQRALPRGGFAAGSAARRGS